VTAYCSQVGLPDCWYIASQCAPHDSHPSARLGHRDSAVLNAWFACSCSVSACAGATQAGRHSRQALEGGRLVTLPVGANTSRHPGSLISHCVTLHGMAEKKRNK
jgi:hypothetical protein